MRPTMRSNVRSKSRLVQGRKKNLRPNSKSVFISASSKNSKRNSSKKNKFKQRVSSKNLEKDNSLDNLSLSRLNDYSDKEDIVSDDQDEEDIDATSEELSDINGNDEDDSHDELIDDTDPLSREVIDHESIKKWQKALREAKNASLEQILVQVIKKFSLTLNVDSSEKKVLKVSNESAEQLNGIVNDPKSFRKFVILILIEVPNAFIRLDNESGKIVDKKIISDYFDSLSRLSENIKDALTIKILFNQATKLQKYLLSSAKTSKALKILVTSAFKTWSSHEDESVRISAYLFVLELMKKAANESRREYLLKSCYQAFVRSCRGVNSFNSPLLNFMKNSAVEIFKVDAHCSFNCIFFYIRQLAIMLRAAYKNNSGSSHENIYKWQFIHCIDFLIIILVSNQKSLKSLNFPMVQIVIGTIKLLPRQIYAPLHLHLISELILLTRATGEFVPVFPFVLEILRSKEIHTRTKPSTEPRPDIRNILKVNAAQIKTRAYQDALIEECIWMICDFLAIYSMSYSFPEVSFSTLFALRQLQKRTQNKKLQDSSKMLQDAIRLQSDFIKKRRLNCDKSLASLDNAVCFETKESAKSPYGVFFASQSDYRQYSQKLESQGVPS